MNTETQNTTDKVFKKATAEIIKMKAGDVVEGVFTGTSEGPWLDPKSGEEKTLTRLYFTKPDDTKFIIFEDGGLRNAMSNANVKTEMLIRIEKHEKTDIGQGRMVNQYDIYIAE